MKNSFIICLVLVNLIVITSCEDKKSYNSDKSLIRETESSSKNTLINDTIKTSIEKGKVLFEGKGMCHTCHHVSEKRIGPSLSEISRLYRENDASIITFLRAKSKPIVDASQYEIMKANFAITKTMTDEELKGLEDYILTH